MSSSNAAKKYQSTIRIALDENFKASDAPVMKDLQILKTGTFTDERYGKFKITTKMFSEMIKNFTDGVRGIIPALDYSHDSGGKAAGWLKDLFTKQDGDETQLWGSFELTPGGQKSLADKDFGYISADFDDNYQDNEEGKKFGCVLLGAALTNRPVIKNMAPAIQLKEKIGKFAEGDQMSAEYSEEAHKKLKEDHEKMCAEMKELQDALGAKDHADAKDKIAAMKGKDKPAEGSPEEEAGESKDEAAAEGDKKMAEMSRKLIEMETKLELKEKETAFAILMSEGKVVEAQRKAFLKGDVAEFAKNAKLIKLSEQGHGGNVEVQSDDAQDVILEKAKKLSEEKKISMGDAIAQVLKADKKLSEENKKKWEA